jgi:cation/acetate symporter
MRGLCLATPCRPEESSLYLGSGAASVGNFTFVGTNPISRDLLVTFVSIFLAAGIWAARRPRTAADFYAAGGGITAFQNGLALAGAYISAASFLGISGLVSLSGYGGLVYSVGSVAGWPLIAILFAERLRNLGRFTVGDAVSFRLAQAPVRILSSCTTLWIVLLYLLSQLVGGGAVLSALLGLNYEWAVTTVGALAILYMALGGMLAATWIQILKACLLLVSMSALAIMVLLRFGFNVDALLAQAISVHPLHVAILSPDQLFHDPVSTISLGMALMFGALGLPHILMRFFSVANATTARRSVLYATLFIGFFFALTFITGFGAIALLPTETLASLAANPSASNVVAVQLSYLLGGGLFLSFFAAAAFATILAVASGLILAGAASVGHDLYAMLFAKEKANESDEVFVSRVATLILGVIAVALALAFKEQNVAFMIGLAYSISASCSFPILFMSLTWKGATTRGIVIGGGLGLIASIAGIVLSPAVWAALFGLPKDAAPFPYGNPTLFSMPLAFAAIWIISKTDFSKRGAIDRAGFEAQFVRAQTGIDASGAVLF